MGSGLEKEQRYFGWVGAVTFLALILFDKTTEALLALIIAHLIDIKYEIKKLNKYNKF